MDNYLLNYKAIYDTMKDPDIIEDDNIFILLQSQEKYPWQKKIREIFENEGKMWRMISDPDLKDFKNFFLYITTIYPDLIRNLPKNINGVFISSDIDPYSEEYLNNTNSIRYKLKRFGIPSYKIHASGHAKPHDIMNYISEINPLYVIPIHTEHSNFFKSLFQNYDINIIIPESYNTIQFQ